MDADRNLDHQSSVTSVDGTPSETVVWAVARAEDVEPTELRSLHEVVDTDALDSLFEHRPGGTITFEYHGYEVTVRENSEVIVQKPVLSDA